MSSFLSHLARTQSQDGSYAPYLKGTACAVHLCARLSRFLSLSRSRFARGSLSLRASSSRGCCAQPFSVLPAAARRLSPRGPSPSTRPLVSLRLSLSLVSSLFSPRPLLPAAAAHSTARSRQLFSSLSSPLGSASLVSAAPLVSASSLLSALPLLATSSSLLSSCCYPDPQHS